MSSEIFGLCFSNGLVFVFSLLFAILIFKDWNEEGRPIEALTVLTTVVLVCLLSLVDEVFLVTM